MDVDIFNRILSKLRYRGESEELEDTNVQEVPPPSETSPLVKPRKWWLAGLLSLLVPGIGQFYNGQAKRGLMLYSLYLGINCVSTLILLIIIILSLNAVAFTLLFVLLLFINLLLYLYITINAIITARREGEVYYLKNYNKWYIYGGAILIYLVIIMPIFEALHKNFLVWGYRLPMISMSPTLTEGDYVLIDNFSYHFSNPKRNDIVLFQYPEDEKRLLINRIIGLSEETVKINKKKIFIDKKLLKEPYAIYQDPPFESLLKIEQNHFMIVKVPKNHYFVMGDNRYNSLDSRHFGTVKKDKIIGKIRVIFRLWDSIKIISKEVENVNNIGSNT